MTAPLCPMNNKKKTQVYLIVRQGTIGGYNFNIKEAVTLPFIEGNSDLALISIILVIEEKHNLAFPFKNMIVIINLNTLL